MAKVRECDKTIIRIIFNNLNNARFGPQYIFTQTAREFKERTGIDYHWRKVERVVKVQ